MAALAVAIIKTVRPRQWLKNLTLFAGIIFTGRLFNAEDFLLVSYAFILFSLLTSSIYIFNDIKDMKADKLHPFKRRRPIASGALPVQLAIIVACVLGAFALIQGVLISPRFFAAMFAYLALQILYMFMLKHIIILDVIAIASGFLLRIYAGLWLLDTHLNVWFLMCVASFALFIAVGKRRAEATLLKGYAEQKHVGAVRATLSHYPESLLHAYTTMFATATWVTYALFAFLQPVVVPNTFFREMLSTFIPRVNIKWIMLTTPFVIYGVMRYLYLVYEKKEGESPERMLLSDRPLLIAVVGWGLMLVIVLYVLSG